PQREYRIPKPSNVSPLLTAGAEIELAPRYESRLYPPALTSSVEVEPTAGVEIKLAPSLDVARLGVGLTWCQPCTILRQNLIHVCLRLFEVYLNRAYLFV
ncbi:hypothetical protein Goklo_005390, partial [Gossypium klotzschianum]|nr:hypothetical protein [Gossypium klotzschianum]